MLMPVQIIYYRANTALAGLIASAWMLAPAAYFLIHWSLEMMSGQALNKVLVARLFGEFQRPMRGHCAELSLHIIILS